MKSRSTSTPPCSTKCSNSPTVQQFGSRVLQRHQGLLRYLHQNHRVPLRRLLHLQQSDALRQQHQQTHLQHPRPSRKYPFNQSDYLNIFEVVCMLVLFSHNHYRKKLQCNFLPTQFFSSCSTSLMPPNSPIDN